MIWNVIIKIPCLPLLDGLIGKARDMIASSTLLTRLSGVQLAPYHLSRLTKLLESNHYDFMTCFHYDPR